MVVVLMLNVKDPPRPKCLMQLWRPWFKGTLNSNFHIWHSTACTRENLCVECVRVQVKK